MAISKIILNGVTQMDVTQDTVASANLLYGETATGADGQQVVGAYVPASPTLQTKSVSYTPTESAQSATVTADQGYDGLDKVNVSVGEIPSEYIIPTGTKTITDNGTGIDVSAFEFADVNVSGGGGYYAEGTYTMTEGTRYFSVSVSFQPKYAYAFVSNWRELGHTSWRRLMLAGKLTGEQQRGQLSSRYLNNAYGSSGGATDYSIASYSNGTLTFDSALGSTTYFPDGAEIVWFAAGDGGE